MTEPGELLRELRAARGISLTKLAEQANYNKGHLSKIENGLRQMPQDMARALDRLLASDGVLTRAVAAPRPAPEPPPEDTAAMVIDPGGQLLLGATRLAPNSFVVDDDLLASFDAEFGHLQALGHRMSPAFVIPRLVLAYTNLRTLLTAEPAAELMRLAYRFAEYAGWMFQEAGNVADAHGWTQTAVRFATKAGDPALGGYALVRAAEIALYDQDGATMVDLARRAAEATGAGPGVLALAAQREAQGHALLGDHTACLSALDKAAHWQELADAESGPRYGTTSLPDPLAVVRGWSMRDLDRSADAVDLLSSAVARIPARSVRSRVRFGVRLALAQADCGDIEGACDRVEALLTDLRRTDSATVRVDLKEFQRILAKHAGDPRARQLRPEVNQLLKVNR